MKTIFCGRSHGVRFVLSAPASAGFFDLTLRPFIGASAGQASFDIDCPAGSSCDGHRHRLEDLWWLGSQTKYIQMEVGYADLVRPRAAARRLVLQKSMG